MTKIYKTLETFGTALAVIGSFLVAMKYAQYGYPFFFISSISMLIAAIGMKNRNYAILNSAFLMANIVGLFNYV